MTWIETERGFITPCHIWSGPKSGAYGWVSERKTFAHRVAWEAECGEIPERMHIHHLCGSKRCVNVTHMELRSASEHRRLHADVARRPSKLSAEDVEDIRTAGESLGDIARFYGISKSYASKVRRGLEPEQFRLEDPLPAWDRGRPKPPRQKGNLSPEDIDLIRNNREFSLTELCEMFGMSRVYMNAVRQGRAPKP
jgi:DNA-binding transcriptional regulator YiaG